MKTVSSRAKYLNPSKKGKSNQSSHLLAPPQKASTTRFEKQRKSNVALKQISVHLTKGLNVEPQESSIAETNNSILRMSTRQHSVSQSYYPPSKDLETRNRNVSTDSIRSHRPVFQKLEQVSVYDETGRDEPKVTFQRTRNQSQQSKSSHRGAKFQLKYQSLAETTTIASTKSKKWSEAYKKQRCETLGFYINCASKMMNQADRSSFKTSLRSSVTDKVTNLSVEKDFNRNSDPVRAFRKSHQNFHSVIEKVSTLSTPKRANKEPKKQSMPSRYSQTCEKDKRQVGSQDFNSFSARNTIISATTKASKNPFSSVRNSVQNDADELLEFVELEDYCRRSTVKHSPSLLSSQKKKSAFKKPTKASTNKFVSPK
jgi:hypothetical protein